MPEIAPRSPQGILMLAIAGRLRTLNIDGVPLENTVVQKFPFNFKDWKPGVFVTPAAERIGGKSNTSDVWTFRTQVTYAKVSNGSLDDQETIEHFGYARHRMMHELLPTAGNQILGGGLHRDFRNLSIDPGRFFDPEAFQANHDATWFVVEVEANIQRVRGSGI